MSEGKPFENLKADESDQIKKPLVEHVESDAEQEPFDVGEMHKLEGKDLADQGLNEKSQAVLESLKLLSSISKKRKPDNYVEGQDQQSL